MWQVNAREKLFLKINKGNEGNKAGLEENRNEKPRVGTGPWKSLGGLVVWLCQRMLWVTKYYWGEYFNAKNLFTDRDAPKTVKTFFVQGLYFYSENIYVHA